MANQIQTAVLAYKTEYNVYPVPSNQSGDQVIGDTSAADGASWATLDCVLCGNIHPSDDTTYTPSATGPINTRGIAFVNLKSSDVFDGTSGYGIKDAPRNPKPSSPTANIYFNIAMDSDNDGVLGASPSAASLPDFSIVTTGAAPPAKGGTSTAGAAVWANCNGTANISSWSSNFFVRTY